MHFHLTVCILAALALEFIDCEGGDAAKSQGSPLSALFEKLQKKRDELKSAQLLSFINKYEPGGIEPPNPKIAEYETYKMDRRVTFIGSGEHLAFRRFRRIRLNDVLSGPQIHVLNSNTPHGRR